MTKKRKETIEREKTHTRQHKTNQREGNEDVKKGYTKSTTTNHDFQQRQFSNQHHIEK